MTTVTLRNERCAFGFVMRGLDPCSQGRCQCGRGAAPPSWPKAREGAFCGYAGGLNPDIIGVTLPVIAACVPAGQPYWIDMESGVRTDDRFDLDKCEFVMMQVYDAG